MARRTFAIKFKKAAAVKLVTEQGDTAARVARSLGAGL
jgi:hypothetical protein